MKLLTNPNFLSQEDVEFIKSYEQPPTKEILNYHIKSVKDAAMGWSIMYDFSKTEISQEITRFQGDGTLVEQVPPKYYEELGHRIAESAGVSSQHMFFQYIVVGPGGQVRKHYDAGKPGYITYKCNVCVEGPEQDVIFVGTETVPVTPRCLYCFEANLFKHWMNASDTTRIHLSYGFIVPYADLGWEADCSRVRLSNKIWKAYIGGVK